MIDILATLLIGGTIGFLIGEINGIRRERRRVRLEIPIGGHW